jgi:hypothetical protein
VGKLQHLLPVVTGVLASIALAGGTEPWRALLLVLSLSLFALARAFLHHAFERERMLLHHPKRPMPRALAEPADSQGLGFFLLAGGLAALLGASLGGTEPRWEVLAISIAVSASVVFIAIRPAPLLVGAGRAIAFITVALAASGHISALVALGAALSSCYTTGFTSALVAHARAHEPRLSLVGERRASPPIRAPITAAWWVAAPLPIAAFAFSKSPPAIACLVILIAVLAAALRVARGTQLGIADERCIRILMAGLVVFDALLMAGAR